MATRMSDGRRTVLSMSLIALMVAIVIVLGDTRAGSVSDPGGKVATVRVMAERDTAVPDVGYWAESLDADGSVHPLFHTSQTARGWVQVTGLPMILVSVPLWDFGGTTAILLLPLVSAPLAAVAARRIARSLGAPSGWGAFWLVGVGSPVFFYAADFWEHAPATAAALWFVALLLDDRETSIVRRSVVLGGLLALAYLLRVEAAIPAVLVAGFEFLKPSVKIRPNRHRAALLGAGAVALSLVTLWSRLEQHLMGAAVRSSRVGNQLAGAGVELGQRGEDALVTTVALWATAQPVSLLAGAGVVGILALSVRATSRGNPLMPMIPAVGVLALLLRLASGLGFIPGGFTAAPGSAASVVAEGRRAWTVVTTAIGAMVVTFALQWRGSHTVVWGGRYVMVSTALLVIVGAVNLERLGWRTTAARAVVASTAIVTLHGALWHVVRTREVAATVDQLVAVPDDVVVILTEYDTGREAGSRYGEQRMLTVEDDVELVEAVAVAFGLGARRVDVVWHQIDPPRIEGALQVGRRPIDFLSSEDATVISFEPAD